MKNIIVRSSSQEPIYQQLYEQIASQILQGDLESNSLLPSIRNMAKEIRVSIITIKKTWELLERNGFIYTIAGRGSYVQENSKSTLEKKKISTIRDVMKENIALSKTIGISKEALIELVSKMYDE